MKTLSDRDRDELLKQSDFIVQSCDRLRVAIKNRSIKGIESHVSALKFQLEIIRKKIT
jgi:hypothetical protein